MMTVTIAMWTAGAGVFALSLESTWAALVFFGLAGLLLKNA
jgi:hypothetical protein